MTDIVRYQPPTPVSTEELGTLMQVAGALAKSGLFKDTRQAEQAVAKVLVGRDLGLSPTEAMMGIHIVEGKPELSASLQASFVKRTPGYDYRVLEHTDQACEIAFYRDGEEIGRSRFTIEDARRAGLAGRNVWKSYPRNMLFARTMSNGVAFHCPEVTGGIRVYHEGEIGTAEPADKAPMPEPAGNTEVVEETTQPERTPPTDAQLDFLKKILRGKARGILKPSRAQLDVVAAGHGIVVDDGWIDRLSKQECSALITSFREDPLPSIEYPTDVPAEDVVIVADPVEGDDDLPFESQQETLV
jgi:hypothetical protein